jgi:hypothetical protein
LRRAVPFVILAALLALSAPPYADDWDGLGFLASIDRFDMAGFAPHAPGYPVYVAALRVASVVGDPRVAAYVVAIASAVATCLLAWRAGNWSVAFAVAATPLAWRASSAIGSEALALAFAVLALTGRTPITIGIAAGLGMGVRLSWAPLFLPMVVLSPHRKKSALAAASAVVAWAVPLAAIVGPSRLVALYRIHAEGHATTWGGTAITDPGIARIAFLARDVFVDGLGAGGDVLGIAIAIAAAALAFFGLRASRSAGFPRAREALLVLGPYIVWIAFGQNLRQQPRHALPIVVALAAALALAASVSKHARIAGGALALLVVARTATDAYARRTIPPAGAQLVDYVRRSPDMRGTAVFGGPSIRFFEGTELAKQTGVLATFDELRLGLSRLDDYPRRVLVTSEVEGAADAHLPLVITLCRPPRIDRRAPCLDVFDASELTRR